MYKKIRTRPNYAPRDFWNSINGMSGGQWGEGFVAGVAAFTRYLNRRRAIITLLPNKRSKITQINVAWLIEQEEIIEKIKNL